MSLATAFTDLESFAKTAVADAVAEGKTFLSQEEVIVAGAANATAANVATDFQDLVGKYGALATKLVTTVTTDITLPLVSEQENLAADQLVQAAAADGVTVAQTAASTLIKNAFLYVTSEIAKL